MHKSEIDNETLESTINLARTIDRTTKAFEIDLAIINM